MGTNSNEEITNESQNNPFTERVSLDQNIRKNKFSQEILQYPLNAGNDGGMTPAGHHIQFEILEQDVGSIKFGELPKQPVPFAVRKKFWDSTIEPPQPYGQTKLQK